VAAVTGLPSEDILHGFTHDALVAIGRVGDGADL